MIWVSLKHTQKLRARSAVLQFKEQRRREALNGMRRRESCIEMNPLDASQRFTDEPYDGVLPELAIEQPGCKRVAGMIETSTET